MQYRHMRPGRPGFSGFFARIIIVLLIIGALFAARNHAYRTGYWQGYTVGTLQGDGAGESETEATLPLPLDASPDIFGGPSPGALLLLALCAIPVLGFFGMLFVFSRARRHRQWVHRAWRSGKSGCGRWGGKSSSSGAGRPNDDDSYVGPEKNPDEYL